MCKALRTIERYNPFTDFRERFGSWDLQVVSDLATDIGEIFLPKRRTCLVSRFLYDLDAERLVAHICAHLTLHAVDVGGPFTRDQEKEADMVADFWLDREDDRLALVGATFDDDPEPDGDPTVIL